VAFGVKFELTESVFDPVFGKDSGVPTQAFEPHNLRKICAQNFSVSHILQFRFIFGQNIIFIGG
jgi:hypothetical protein